MPMPPHRCVCCWLKVRPREGGPGDPSILPCVLAFSFLDVCFPLDARS